MIRESPEKFPESLELKGQYEVTCPYCRHEFCFRPSMMMEMGLNIGRGECLKCKSIMELRIQSEANLGYALKLSERDEIHNRWKEN